MENNGKPKSNMYYRPKFYGEKMKGVPHRAILVGQTEKTKTYRYQKPLKRAESIRTNQQQNKWVEIEKTLSTIDDKRVWNGNESQPISINL